MNCNNGEVQAQEDFPVNNTDNCHSNKLDSERDPPVNDTEDCHTEDIESEEYPANKESSLDTMKSEFYAEVDKKMGAISQDQRAKHIMSDDQFNENMNFSLSIKNATSERSLSLIMSYPHEIAYKWKMEGDWYSMWGMFQQCAHSPLFHCGGDGANQVHEEESQLEQKKGLVTDMVKKTDSPKDRQAEDTDEMGQPCKLLGFHFVKECFHRHNSGHHTAVSIHQQNTYTNSTNV
ncbi:hypothetical protein HJC23_001385 [Cyclotella cryptica]|uniref:Uncharacterized protein n=1 Tax=Cyclotella cryptica TaxID=29204 RepID=A0ABD3PAK3_9STRA